MSKLLYKYEYLSPAGDSDPECQRHDKGHMDSGNNDDERAPAITQGYTLRTLAIACTLSSVFSICSVWLSGRESLKECGRRLSSHSPALDIVSYKAPEHFVAQIVQTNRWRGKLGHDPRKYDDAWEAITAHGTGVRLFEDDIKKMGKSLEGPQLGMPLHKIPPESGGGGYTGQLEVFHLLHCLDWLRKGIYYNWEYYKDSPHFKNLQQREMQSHQDHCIDILRIHLMCAADVTPVTDYDTPYRAMPFPDFSTKHTCRDFDAILDWSMTNPRKISLEPSFVGDSTLWNGTYQQSGAEGEPS